MGVSSVIRSPMLHKAEEKHTFLILPNDSWHLQSLAKIPHSAVSHLSCLTKQNRIKNQNHCC